MPSPLFRKDILAIYDLDDHCILLRIDYTNGGVGVLIELTEDENILDLPL
jgi:hypothetical protein